MSVEHDTLGPYDIVRDDFLDDANTDVLTDLGRLSPHDTAHLNRCAALAQIANQVCSVQSVVNPGPVDQRTLNELCQEILRTRIKRCTFIKPSPADLALERVLKQLGLGNGAIENLRGMNEDETRKAQDFVLEGFVTRLREALQSEDFCKAQRAWLKAVNKSVEICDRVLDTLEASNPPVSCVRHDVVCHLDREGITQEEWPQSLVQRLFELPASLGLIAVLCRGERLPFGDFRLHVVIFFGGGTNNDPIAVKMATQACLARSGSTCSQPLGYRSAGEGLLVSDCKQLRRSLRLMLSRDEFARSRCSPTLTFSFHGRDGDTFCFPVLSSEEARQDDSKAAAADDDIALLIDATIDSGLPEELNPCLKWRPIGSKYHLRYSPESLSDADSGELAIKQKKQRTRDEYKEIIAWLNDFTRLALSTTEKPIVPKLLPRATLSLDLSRLAQHYIARFPVMVEVAGKFSDQNRYDEYIELFRDACSQLGLYKEILLEQPSFWVSLENELLDHITGPRAGIFNNFVETLRRLGREKNATRRRIERLRDAKERHRDYCRYFDSLITRYRRLVVVRVELGYQKTALQCSMSTLKQDFDVFLRGRRSNQDVSRGLVGYVVKFEYGVDRGPHIHLVLIFDGDKRQGCAKFFSEKMGEYWKTVTKGRGSYRNGHLHDEEYARRGTLGIGLIHVDDQKKRENFCNYVLTYLCKADSFAHPKEIAGFRVIRRGELPKKSYPRKKSTAAHEAKPAKAKKRLPYVDVLTAEAFNIR